MNFVDAQNLAILVDRYNELKRNKEQMERNTRELIKDCTNKRQYSLVIMTEEHSLTYGFTNESVIAFMLNNIEYIDNTMKDLLKKIEEY